jgi:uncharacterized protein YdbL (DUF1318 family)
MPMAPGLVRDDGMQSRVCEYPPERRDSPTMIRRLWPLGLALGLGACVEPRATAPPPHAAADAPARIERALERVFGEDEEAAITAGPREKTLADHRARIKQRWPGVEALKARGVIGENNRGYLEARASLNGEEQSLVSTENSDRAALYESVAKEQGLPVEQVGRGRARKLSVDSKRGVWLQGNDGVWYQKP